MKMKIAILGSTGSIGKNTLEIINKNINKFELELLTTNSNVTKLYNQAIQFKVKDVVIFNKNE